MGGYILWVDWISDLRTMLCPRIRLLSLWRMSVCSIATPWPISSITRLLYLLRVRSLSRLYSLWSRRWHDGPTFLINCFASVAKFVQTPALAKQSSVLRDAPDELWNDLPHPVRGCALLIAVTISVRSISRSNTAYIINQLAVLMISHRDMISSTYLLVFRCQDYRDFAILATSHLSHIVTSCSCGSLILNFQP